MSGKTQQPAQTTFELKAGPRLGLKPAKDPAPAAPVAGEAPADPPAAPSQKELILRVVEALKDL